MTSGRGKPYGFPFLCRQASGYSKIGLFNNFLSQIGSDMIVSLLLCQISFVFIINTLSTCYIAK